MGDVNVGHLFGIFFILNDGPGSLDRMSALYAGQTTESGKVHIAILVYLDRGLVAR